MLKNSRVVGTLDTARLGNALRGPGMDTRTWVSLAIVTAVTVDPDEGVFVDVRLMPSRQPETARVGSEYAGAGFGLYVPIDVDDEVLVEAPSGDPDHGLVVTRRLHGAADPPPADVVDYPDDVLMVVRPGRSVRIIADGGGDVVLEARGSSSVRLGGPAASRGAAREGDSVDLAPSLVPGVTLLEAMLDARYTVQTPTSHLPATTVAAISSASGRVKVVDE